MKNLAIVAVLAATMVVAQPAEAGWKWSWKSFPFLSYGHKKKAIPAVSVPTGGVVPVSPIPEPETYAMMLVGLGLVGWMARRRKRK